MITDIRHINGKQAIDYNITDSLLTPISFSSFDMAIDSEPTWKVKIKSNKRFKPIT